MNGCMNESKGCLYSFYDLLNTHGLTREVTNKRKNKNVNSVRNDEEIQKITLGSDKRDVIYFHNIC